MMETNEYAHVLRTLYQKSLTLENPAGFHPVLGFFYFDAMAHLDYSISILAYSNDSPRNLMSREYLKHRHDLSNQGDLEKFPGFMRWLEVHSSELYEKFPLFVQKIYSAKDPAQYRSFRIVLNPDDKQPLPPNYFSIMIDEFFDRSYLNILYNGSKVADLLDEYIKNPEKF